MDLPRASAYTLSPDTGGDGAGEEEGEGVVEGVVEEVVEEVGEEVGEGVEEGGGEVAGAGLGLGDNPPKDAVHGRTSPGNQSNVALVILYKTGKNKYNQGYPTCHILPLMHLMSTYFYHKLCFDRR